MDQEMADEETKMIEETPEDTTEAKEEVKEENLEGSGDASATQPEEKTEEEMEQELKETPVAIPRYTAHNVPDWDLEEMKERWMWNIKIYPIDQEDCRNCLLDSATKIAQESWYYVPKRKNGQGTAVLSMASASEAKQVMGRILRMPFYYHFVTIEVSNRGNPNTPVKEESETPAGPFKQVYETATIVMDSTKCERIKNTAKTVGNLKRRNLWVRYLPENTTSDLLRVVFPLTQSVPEVQTHDDLRIGVIETNSKTDVLMFIKAYLTVTINGKHILSLQNKEPENESETRNELEQSVTAIDQLEAAPVEAADRSEMRKTDKSQTNRILKRTLHQQQKTAENRRRDNSGKGRGGRGGEPPAKRGGGNWGDRRSGGGDRRYGGGYSGGSGGGYGMEPSYGPRGGRPGYGGMMDTQAMASEMMMMQAQLNQTIKNHFRMLNPREEAMGYGGGYSGGRGSGGRRGGGGGRGGGGRKGYGNGWN